MPLLSKLLQAMRLPSEAFYSLYFDLFSADPDGLAKKARSAVRTAYFEKRGSRRIPACDLRRWLAVLSGDSNHNCSQVTLPLGLFNTGDVGTISYFYVLAAICSTMKPKSIVEFGTFLGAGTLTMAMNCDARILTLDLPDETDGSHINTLNEADSALVVNRHNRTGSFYKLCPEASRITELRCDSRTVNLTSHVSSADLCLVDGGHSLDCVRADTENALRVLSPNGIILWDDYFWLYPDVVCYIEEFAGTHKGMVRIKNTGLIAWSPAIDMR